ncbi:hypothetical protein QNH46_16320 [Paenibacillus woosongensis]|uniref:Butirosin biosynthesis protein H N-terminal domain-containing protein n=1 Tax=Paenibacillus woosongensis TaxID=307580 RepID=A0AA95I2R5_9BACL|nr:hypothetical protein [Paenibacillus woosongensis]WHX47701.1 hypothetical protein QNH46_16320 [Paenibacillus woosongensis]
MRKVLDVERPTVAVYKRYSHFLAIMEKDKEALGWVINHFLQLQTEKPIEEDVHWLSFYTGHNLLARHCNNPFLYIQEIETKLVSSLTDLGQFIINCINNDQFVYINCNSYYIPNSTYYLKHHKRSQILVTGYHLEEGLIYYMDYSLRGHYELLSLPISNFTDAAMQGFVGEPNNRAKILVIEREKDVKYQFNIRLAYNLLSDYLHARNTYERFSVFPKPRDHALFGMGIYSDFSRYIELLGENNTKVYHTVLPYQVLMEHKRCLSLLIQYLTEHSYIEHSDELILAFAKIDEKALILRNTYIKYHLSKDISLKKRLLFHLDEIKNMELDSIPKLIAILEKRI